MGFWDTAGKLAKGAANALEQQANEIQAIKIRLEEKSSEELRRIVKEDGFFSASQMEKRVAVKLLRDRGEI